MRQIRTAVTAAAAITLAFALSPAASARSCGDGEAACPATAAATVAQQENPMKLDNFMTTWKPVSTSRRAKRSKSAKRLAAKQTARQQAPAAAATAPEPTPDVATVADAVASPAQSIETDGVAVTSFNEVNELDAAADQIQVVASNDVNEIDLATPAPPVQAEAVAQSIRGDRTPAPDNSWIGKLLLAAAGTIALAGATRFLVA
jgi:hypothetical protein